jgi:hypothetical protein
MAERKNNLIQKKKLTGTAVINLFQGELFITG